MTWPTVFWFIAGLFAAVVLIMFLLAVFVGPLIDMNEPAEHRPDIDTLVFALVITFGVPALVWLP